MKISQIKQKKRILAIIPARAGSKRLPKKNKRLIAGKPLIQWTIDAALNSPSITDVVVTTDDRDIMQIAYQSTRVIVICRPKGISGDKAGSEEVVFHALQTLTSRGLLYDYFVLLQPTSPLRGVPHIESAVRALSSANTLSVASVVKSQIIGKWTCVLTADHIISSLGNMTTGIQRANSDYELNGAIYLISTQEFFIEKKFIVLKKTFAYEMHPNASIDIDNESDFTIAESLLRKKIGIQIDCPET